MTNTNVARTFDIHIREEKSQVELMRMPLIVAQLETLAFDVKVVTDKERQIKGVDAILRSEEYGYKTVDFKVRTTYRDDCLAEWTSSPGHVGWTWDMSKTNDWVGFSFPNAPLHVVDMFQLRSFVTRYPVRKLASGFNWACPDVTRPNAFPPESNSINVHNPRHASICFGVPWHVLTAHNVWHKSLGYVDVRHSS